MSKKVTSKKRTKKKNTVSNNKKHLRIRASIGAILIIVAILLSMTFILSQKKIENANTYVYFTGNLCPTCEFGDNVISTNLKKENIFVIIYDFYAYRENGHLLLDYNEKFEISPGLPNLVLDTNKYLHDKNIELVENKVILTKEGPKSLEELKSNMLGGTPTLMYNNKAIILKNKNTNMDFIKDFFKGKKTKFLKTLDYEKNQELIISKINQKYKFKVEYESNVYYFN